MEVSIRDAVVDVPEGQSLFDALRTVGVSAVELSVNEDFGLPRVTLGEDAASPSIRDRDATAALAKRFQSEGVRIVGLLLATDFSGDRAGAHVAWAVRALQAAGELGAPVVRLDTATRRGDLPVPVIRDNLVRRVREVLEQTSESGVDIGLENHGSIANDPEFLDAVLSAVSDARLGLTLDTGNFYWWGLPLGELYRTLEHFAPRAKHTHVKNIGYPEAVRETRRAVGWEYGRWVAPLAEGDIEMSRVVGILRAAGYTRTLCVEDESLGKFPAGERLEVLRRDVETLKDALAGQP